MNANVWIDPRIEKVSAAGVQSYLLGRGWRIQPFPRPELLVFEGPRDDDGTPILQVLPASETLHDFRMRLEELISALGVLEDRSGSDILTDILQSERSESGSQQKPYGIPALEEPGRPVPSDPNSLKG